MAKRYLLLLIPVAIAIVFYLPRRVMSADARTQAYLTIQHQWSSHWPFETGKYATHVLLAAAQPMAPVWFQVEPNIRMRLDPEDLVPLMILETGQYEPGSVAMVNEHLGPGATFIDIGADIGYYSLKAAPLVGPTGHVIAVEPNPEALERMRVNLAASSAGVVAVAPVACADVEGTLDLYVAPTANMGETSLSKANASQLGSVAHTYKVRARPLDDIVRESGVTRVDAIKIDVEGAETIVLKGAQQTLDRFHPMLLVEVVDRQLRAMGTSSAQLREFLKAHGYREGRHNEYNVEFLPIAAVSANAH